MTIAQHSGILSQVHGVALPLSIAAASNADMGLLILSTAVGLASTGPKIGGPIRCGVGGSMANDEAYSVGAIDQRPVHWGFYRAGWAFVIASSALGTINSFNLDPNSGFVLRMVSTGLTLAGDAMWITSCATSLSYAKNVAGKADLRSRIEIHPYFPSNKSAGIAVPYRI